MLSTQELKTLGTAELLKELAKATEKLREVQIQIRTKHVANISLAKKSKRYVAQIQTFLRDAELDEKVKMATQL